ncbi:hypothetical protein FGO68_gene8950 [Halteria grandinella]|uniref:Uncharacterized protein n=1 Tax=Halteria grandinella TaxID=5974 RepID=A0A8J8NSX5_HALGN|nr:hypothetical protein FGO68_gene8950 [Halteria grandinella]
MKMSMLNSGTSPGFPLRQMFSERKTASQWKSSSKLTDKLMNTKKWQRQSLLKLVKKGPDLKTLRIKRFSILLKRIEPSSCRSNP